MYYDNMHQNKAQGTIEYLIIVAVVIVIALVVVGILLNFGKGGAIGESDAKINWGSATPWGIIEWDANLDTLTIVLKNNTANTLDFTSISVNGTTNSTAKTSVTSGTTLVRTISKSCSGSYNYNTITISYSSKNIPNQTQYGATSIIGTCTAQ